MSNKIASFSGGKDSTAMVLRLIEESWPLDEIVFLDTGWEFPQMYKHIDKVEKYIERPIVRFKNHIDFEYLMLHYKIIARKGTMKGKVHRIGYGWPSWTRRWCTKPKISTIARYIPKGSTQYIGIAKDEMSRATNHNTTKHNRRYPLIEWNMKEVDCLEYCFDRDFDWGGLYTHFERVSCFCCPFQRIGELRNLRQFYPVLWLKMLAWENEMEKPLRGFRGYTTVHDLDKRFMEEERQGRLIGI